jgi:hypothetical protein
MMSDPEMMALMQKPGSCRRLLHFSCTVALVAGLMQKLQSAMSDPSKMQQLVMSDPDMMKVYQQNAARCC